MRVVDEENGRRHAEQCVCRRDARTRRLVTKARIPRRFEECRFENYEYKFNGADPSLAEAFDIARRFVKTYPMTDGTGLLLTGSAGIGKTHLVVSTLQALMRERGAQGLFYDYRELLKQVQNSYNPNVAATELEVLAPVFNAEVLVLDEIGASKPTDWVWDTVAHILNSRYNEKRITILTSNFPNLPPQQVLTEEEKEKFGEHKQTATLANRTETLGDRIGERMRSRLQEMCIAVEMSGGDFRRNQKKSRKTMLDPLYDLEPFL